MSVDEAHRAVDWMLSFCREFGISEVSVLWHGGEPLLMGVDFMRDVLAYVKNSFEYGGVRCSQSIQTNLSLYMDGHDKLIREYFNGTIGFSYDYGSTTRRYPNGKSAAQDVWATAERCKAKGFLVGAICQLTSENRYRPEQLYWHFKAAGIHFNLTPVFSTGLVSDIDKALHDIEDDLDAARKVFDLWFFDEEPTIEIGNFKEIVTSLLTGRGTKCCYQEDCARVILALAPGGKIFPCTRFVQDEDAIGSFLVDFPKNVYEKRMSCLRPKDWVQCHSCRYFGICRGGCPYHGVTGWHECECLFNKGLLAHIEGRIRDTGHQMGICLADDTCEGLAR